MPYSQTESQFAMIAEFAGFKDNSASSPFIIAATHLKSKPGYEERRFKQGSKLLNEVKVMRSRNCTTISDKTIPAILCGDYNDIPDSLVCELVSQSYQNISNINGKLVKDDKNLNRNISWTIWKERKDTLLGKREVKRIIDYMWVSDDIEILSKSHYVSDVEGPLPSEKFLSDHLQIIGKFKIKNE